MSVAMAGLLSVVGLTVASGGVSGWLDNRWGQPVDLLAAGKNLERAPSQVGDWLLENSKPLSAEVTDVLQCSGSTQRVYRNQKTGDVVTLALIVGPPGPTSVHTPEVCYSSRDYKTISAPQRFRAIDAGSRFWGMTLEATDLEGGRLSVAYAWNDGHGWVAPDQPRFQFGGAKLLYKLQLAAPMDRGNPAEKSNPCQTFLREFLPALDSVLFQQQSSAEKT
ncbi:MAG TPA: exosortase-associated EpsI family protein [Pirellulales bacterium]|nr:exosortase-associated EpsI family protein [Pirellulales bacterium]